MYDVYINSINTNELKNYIRKQSFYLLTRNSDLYLRFNLDEITCDIIATSLSEYVDLFEVKLPIIDKSWSNNTDAIDSEIETILQYKIQNTLDISFKKGALVYMDNINNDIELDSNYIVIYKDKNWICLLNPTLISAIE